MLPWSPGLPAMTCPGSTADTRERGSMSTQPPHPVSSQSLRLSSGLEILDNWARNASEVEKTAVYEVLFAVSERSVFSDYATVDDSDEVTEFSVLTRCRLAVKLRLHSMDLFGIVYIGPACSALHPEC